MTQQTGGPRVGETLVGKYKLDSVLGVGGMGEVYRARNELMGRPVAIKTLRAELVQNQEVVQRFLREARAANAVRHPNVVDVLDVGTDEHGAPFIVQELLEGETLGQYTRTRGGKLSADEVLQLLLPVCEAVAYAHNKGVVHRDLKPANVFLTRMDGVDGVVPKVLDFGIAKILSSEDLSMTSTGASLGTPTYMSPEQVQGLKTVDARTDVWALGVMLYQALAGAAPFRGESAGALFVAICTTDAIPLRVMAPDVSVDMERVVSRCLRREALNRYPTAAELARDLRNLRDGRELEPTAQIATPDLSTLTGNNPFSGAFRPGSGETTGRNGISIGTGRTLAPAIVSMVAPEPAPVVKQKSRGLWSALAAVVLVAGVGTGVYLSRTPRAVNHVDAGVQPPPSEPRVSNPPAPVAQTPPAKPEVPAVIAQPAKPALPASATANTNVNAGQAAGQATAPSAQTQPVVQPDNTATAVTSSATGSLVATSGSTRPPRGHGRVKPPPSPQTQTQHPPAVVVPPVTSTPREHRIVVDPDEYNQHN